MILSKKVKENIYAALLYMISAAVSYSLNVPDLYFFPIWLPVAVSASYLLKKGSSVLPGFAGASLVTHSLLAGLAQTVSYFSWATVMLLTLSELIILYGIVWIKEKKNWDEVTFRKGNEVNSFIVFTLISPIPMVLAYGWFFLRVSHFSFLPTIVSLYCNSAVLLLLITPLFANSLREKTESVFKSTKYILIFSLTIFAILLLAADAFIFRWFQTSSKTLFYFLAFPAFIYLSIKYSKRLFNATLVLFVFGLIFCSWYFTELINSEDITQRLLETSGFLLIVSVSSIYFKENYTARIQAIKALKSEYSNVDEEISRQVNEYRLMNDKLFHEIERRGVAERELENSKKLLSEAQNIGRISTWEYSFASNDFKWISQIDRSILSNVNDERILLSTISSIIHPNDIKHVKIIIKGLLSGKLDFEAEVRLKKTDGYYGYYLVRGRGFSDNGNISRVLGLLMDVTDQKEAENIVREKEQKYQALFESNIDPISVVDAESLEIIDVNPAFENLYGYSRSELIGNSYTLVSNQPEETKTTIAFAAKKGFYRVNHRIHKKKSGEAFFVEGSLMTYIVEGKQLMFIISHDITHRKEAEQKLAEREQKFRAFFESDLIGMAEISITKEWISFNHKLVQILGYSIKELNELTWDQITHPDDLLVEDRLFKQLLTHETESYSIEKRFIAKNSRIVFCKVTVKSVKSAISTISHFIKLIEDITDRKKAEQELLLSRAKLSHSQSVAKLGTIRFIPGNNQLLLSDEAFEMLGFKGRKPTLTRRDLFKSLIPGSKTRFEEHICNLETGVEVEGSFEQSFITSKGEVKYLLTNYGISRNDLKQVAEVVVTLADISRIKQAEMDLQEANDLKDQLFSIIGHDLRSPIGAMKQLIDLYSQSWKEYDEESAKSILETLRVASDETYKLLENLLEWAKSQKTTSFKPVKTDLVTIVDQVIALSKGMAESKSITFQTNLPSNAVTMVDSEMIKTIFRNLISNSMKFTPHSGMVSISIAQENDSFLVTVADTGKGIPADVIPNLFDNTKTYTTLGTDNEKGTGLGLKLVKKFVERNGGSISVESTPGQGSAFTFTVPKYAEHD